MAQDTPEGSADLQEVVAEGEAALRSHRQGLDRVMWIGRAFDALQQEAMRRSHSNNPIGKRYNDCLAALMHLHTPAPQLTKVNKTDRAQFMWCYVHHAQLETWWPTLADNQRDRWGHPDTIKKQYLKAHGVEPVKSTEGGTPAAGGLRAQVIRLQEENDRLKRDNGGDVLNLRDNLDDIERVVDELVLTGVLPPTRAERLARIFRAAAKKRAGLRVS